MRLIHFERDDSQANTSFIARIFGRLNYWVQSFLNEIKKKKKKLEESSLRLQKKLFFFVKN